MTISSTLLTATLTASALLAQAPGPPVLVHLYPAAIDASGQPVTDLTAADFKIADENKPESVYFFRKPDTAAPAPLAPLERANRLVAGPHTMVILFDMLNMNQADRLETWKAFDKNMPQMDSGENVYFYVMNLEGTLIPIHAFGPKSDDDKTWPKNVAPLLDKVMKAASVARPVQVGQEDMVKKTYKALEDLSAQLAEYPGRHDIIWVTNGIQNVYNTKHPCNGDWVECALYVPHLGFTLDKNATAVNPLCYSSDLSPDVNRDLGEMARLTGGHAYFREDVQAVVKEVGLPAANSYLVDYEPAADNWDNKWHVIHITCERKGVKLQVRERYYALPDSRQPLDRLRAPIIAALQSPTDIAQIGLRTKFSPIGGGKPGVHLAMQIDPADILLREDGGKYKGLLFLLISDRNASGPIGQPAQVPLSPELTGEQRDMLMKAGAIPLEQDHPTADATQFVRLILVDANTGALGSLTIPVK